MWAAKFLFSPGGKFVALALALVLWTAYQRADATADCKEAQVRAQLEAANRQLEAANRLAEQARDRAQQTMDRISQLEGERDGILAQLRDQPACIISDELRERLRAIR